VEPVRHSGLVISSPDTLTDEERTAFHDFYEGWKGERLRGHEFLLEFRPDVLKRYLWGVREVHRPGASIAASSAGVVHYYAITGWLDGLRQHAFLLRDAGVQKSEFLDLIAIAALHAGPRGMQQVADELTLPLRDWVDPEPKPRWPQGWAFDPAAFDSGLDFSTPTLSPEEQASLFGWYEKVLGTVPRTVRTLAQHRPGLLKAYRNRFEHLLVGGLPIQMVAWCQLQLNLYRGNGEGVRNSALLGLGLGMTPEHLIDCVMPTFHYGGADTIALFDQYAGDLVAP